MFLNFKISNFLSIKDDLEVSFSITKAQKIDNTSVCVGNSFVNKLGCIVGPNASGKTNLFRALVSFFIFIEGSYLGKKVYIEPHFFKTKDDTMFSTEFTEGENQYKYEIVLNEQVVRRENLRKLNKKTNRYNDVFLRENNKAKIAEGLKINEEDLKRLSSDISLFSLLKHLNYFKIWGENINSFSLFLSNVSPKRMTRSGRPMFRVFEELTDKMAEDETLKRDILNEVKKIDLGISDMLLVDTKKQVSNSEGETEQKGILPEEKNKLLITVHKDGNEIAFLSLFDASEGTINYISLFSKIRNILNTGGIMLADELENSLHVDLVERILNLFIHEKTNPLHAQILFSTHNPWFLQYLTKTQIFIAEKEHQSTDIFRLDDIPDVRNDENYFMKYIAGEYDGKPKIKGEAVLNVSEVE